MLGSASSTLRYEFWMLPLLGVAWAAPLDVSSIPNPRRDGAWVADAADVLPADVEGRINARVDRQQADLDAEIAVVTAHDVALPPKEFATTLLNPWGVGDADANNGVLVLLVVDARRVEIAVGYGLEGVLSDGATGRLLDERVAPAFK